MSLSSEEIAKRMQELRNLRRLHALARDRINELENIIKQLKHAYNDRVMALEKLVDAQEKMIAELKLRVEELSTIVFGKKHKNEENYDIDDTPPSSEVITNRTPESYKRSIPKENEVTETKPHPLESCTHCGGHISEKDIVTYYVEDIPLPQKKIVVKHIVEKGYCETCDLWMTEEPLPPAAVTFGPNVKRYVTYLSVITRQSYGQIQGMLDCTYNFNISQGQIAKILNKEGEHARPEYERLKAKIRGEPSLHLDETGWDLQEGDGYKRFAWTMTGGQSGESVFALGKTRGKGNAVELLGDSKAPIITDDYGAYRNLENPHQLCCAHILRKLRDLAESGELEGKTHDHCVSTYREFKEIYADIENARTSTNPESFHKPLLKRLYRFGRSHRLDPAKLMRVKKQVNDQATNYLTCFLHEGVASDNNAAERSLRHLVLKRKISFGSFREKTAETLAILTSVLLAYKQRGTLRDYLQGV